MKEAPTAAAYLANQSTATNAAVIAVEMRRPIAAALNQSQTDGPGLRGGINVRLPDIIKTGDSQYWQLAVECGNTAYCTEFVRQMLGCDTHEATDST